MKQIFNSKNRMFVAMLAISMVILSMNFMPVAVATAEALYQDYSRTVISVWGVVSKRVVGLDSLRAQGPALFNSTATFASQITLSGVGVATRDSFSTTSTTKAVALTGATLSDVFIVTPLTTTYSTAVDTAAAFYWAKFDSAGYVTVGRTALNAVALKSGAHFGVMKLNK